MGYGAAAVAAIGAWIGTAAAGTAGAVAVGGALATTVVGTVTVGAIAGAVLEGVVIGAVVGGATSAMSGGDILQGALKGAALGGVTAGVGSYIGGAIGALTSTTSAMTSELGIAAGDMTIANADAALSAQAANAGTTVGASGAVAEGVGKGLDIPGGGVDQGLIGSQTTPVADKAAASLGGTQSVNTGSTLSTQDKLFAEAFKANAEAAKNAQMYQAAGLATTALGPVLTSLGSPDQMELLDRKYALEDEFTQKRINANQSGETPLYYKKLIKYKEVLDKYGKQYAKIKTSTPGDTEKSSAVYGKATGLLNA